MNIELQNRKKSHFLLLGVIILIQIIALLFWYQQKTSQNNFTEANRKALEPNRAFYYANKATYFYFETENNFANYLHKGSENTLKEYRTSLGKMTIYLDSLSAISEKNSNFDSIVNKKATLGKEIISLNKNLNDLLDSKKFKLFDSDEIDFKVKKYDYSKVLSSIAYDTVKNNTNAKKKGLFGRLGGALAGKSDVDKEQIQTKIKMVFNNTERVGTFEDQLKNIFQFSEKYYLGAFNNIKNNYTNLSQAKNKLININNQILAKSQELLMLYSIQNQKLNLKEYEKSVVLYDNNLQKSKFTTISFILIALLISVLLFFYTLYNYKQEDALNKAKLIAEKSNSYTSRLIGMLSHEIRAPLSIIANQTILLKEKNKDKDLDTNIKNLNFTSNSLQITVNQILEYYKNKGNAISLYNSKINLEREVASIINSLQSLAELKDIKISSNFYCCNEQCNWVWADKVKVHQLFYNIIGNAIKFSGKGEIKVKSETTPLNDNKVQFDVAITDFGCGIPKEELEMVFNEFFQSSKHENQRGFGAGLGLNLCKEIVELYNGKITVDSEVNKGTTFLFHLILDISKKEELTNKTRLLSKFENRTIQVAVIDDDKIASKVIEKLLDKINFKHTTFDNVPAFKKHLNKNTVDLIITDIQIGNYSGFDLARDIKTMKNTNANAAIIAITADSFINAIEIDKQNFNAVIIKPIEKEEFYHKLVTVLS